MATTRDRVQGLCPLDGRGQFLRGVTDHAGHPLVDHFAHSSAVQRHNRRPACHGFDHHHAERFLPLHGKHQASRTGEQLALAGRIDLTAYVVVLTQQGLSVVT